MQARIVHEAPEAYHAVKALSNSGIGKILECPAKFKAWQDGGADKDTEAKIFGSVFHCLTLEPDEFGSRYAIKTKNGNTKEGKAEKLAADAAGLVQIKPEMHHNALGMAEALRSHKKVGRLLKSKTAMREISIYWTEQVNGQVVPCKARLDFKDFMPGFGWLVLDLKSTDSADPNDLPRSLYKWGYYRQDHWYSRAMSAIGEEVAAFVFALVEKEAPYLNTVCTLPQSAKDLGRAECEKALATYAQCQSTDYWPCYTEQNFTEIDLPSWAYKQAQI